MTTDDVTNAVNYVQNLLTTYNAENGVSLSLGELLAIEPDKAFKPKRFKAPKPPKPVKLKRTRAEAMKAVGETNKQNRREAEAEAMKLIEELCHYTLPKDIAEHLSYKGLKTHRGKEFTRWEVVSRIKDLGLTPVKLADLVGF